GRACGRVRVVERLLSVQAERLPEATVLIADVVGGNEEIPEGVTAVLTADAPDLVAHVAVRARNAGVLFATCFEPEVYARLKGLRGKTLSLRVTPGGDVEYEEAEAPAGAGAPAGKESHRPAPRGLGKGFAGWVVTPDR